jgi:hypothetical protein
VLVARIVLRRDDVRELEEQLALDLEVLEHGLDDQIAVARAVEGRRGGDPRARRLRTRRRHQLALDRLGQRGLDRAEALLELGGSQIHEPYLEPLGRDLLRDAGAHVAGADHGDSLDLPFGGHARLLLGH